MKRPFFISIVFIFVLLTSSCEERPGAFKFEPMEIEGLEAKPDFWKVRTDEIISVCENLRTGKSEIVARTPLGFPVYAVFYGDFSEAEPESNWSSMNSSCLVEQDIWKNRIQTIMVIAGVHGSEPENVAAAVNLIQLLETGTDFRGRTYPELMELAKSYRFIIMPCVNMDGRSISPDHLRGQAYDTFRKASQGTWKDGRLIGWKGSKEYFPLPLDKVEYPGGYPNSEGYNIQHDVSPGDMKTEEAKAVCRLAARWSVDFCLNCHSCEYQPFVRYPSQVETAAHIKLGSHIASVANEALFKNGLRVSAFPEHSPAKTINLTNIINWCSGGLGMTLETTHSYDNINSPSKKYSFDEMIEPAFVVLTEVLKIGLNNSLSDR